jgi:hypothetical protein
MKHFHILQNLRILKFKYNSTHGTTRIRSTFVIYPRVKSLIDGYTDSLDINFYYLNKKAPPPIPPAVAFFLDIYVNLAHSSSASVL